MFNNIPVTKVQVTKVKRTKAQVTKVKIKKGRSMPQQKGFTFIEVLIAFAILSTSIVGAVAVQGLATKASVDAVQRVLATSLANDIVQRMRVNVTAVSNQHYNGTYTTFVANSSRNNCRASCTSAQMSGNDLYEWKMAIFGADVSQVDEEQNSRNIGGLLSPTACIEHFEGAVSVVIAWNGREAMSDASSSKSDGSLASSCGTASTKRRQVYIDTFIL
jgi:type IV pilus assembly protein PilV